MFSLLLRLPLAAKSGLVAALICAIAGLTLLLTSMTASKQILLETTQLIGQQWTTQLASQAQHALLRNDRVSLQAILQDYISNPLITYGSIENARQETVAEAGLWQEDDLNYDAGVADDGILGRVQLSLSKDTIANEIRDLGKTLLILTAILASLSYALVAVPMRRIESHLELARQRLAQPLRDDEPEYRGDDSLGRLLHEIHDPQIRLTELEDDRFRDYYLIHCHWQGLATLKEQMSPDAFRTHRRTTLARAEAIARLYQGEMVIRRHDALTLRFFDISGCDHPLFRALCCADLFQKLDKALKTRCGVARVCCDGDSWEWAASESETIERLHIATAEGRYTWLDNNCRDHERIDAWSNRRGGQITSMKAPYSDLLARQQTQLKNLSLESLQRSAEAAQEQTD